MMGPNVQIPSTGHMEALIHAAFEATPQPDGLRLGQIQADLPMRQPMRSARSSARHLPWWAVGLLMAGFATAGWWAGSAWRQSKDTDPLPVAITETTPTEPHATTEPSVPQGEGEAPLSEADVPDGNPRSPVIYQRETD